MARRDAFTARSSLVDAATAVVLALLAVRAILDPPGPAFTGPAWVGCLAGVAVSLPMALRRRWPLPALGFLIVAGAVATWFGAVGTGVMWVSWLGTALALYTAANTTSMVTAVAALVGSLTAAAVTIPWFYQRSGITPADAPQSEAPLWWQIELGMVAAEMITAWGIGRVIRWRRLIQADLARRMARDAVADERLRIARELHDIVGHSMSLIAVKATVANHITDERPDQTRAALQLIEQTSRAALAEIRRILDVLRADDDPAGELEPPPSMADLPELAERLTSAGLTVELSLTGVDDLPQALDLTVYRIVQEAFTNVLKHANARHCSATVRAPTGSINIKITDDGQGLRAAGHRRTGHGLIGMQERVGIYGGTLTTSSRPEGGFVVVADIPYTPEETA